MNFGFYISNVKKDEQALNSFAPVIASALEDGTLSDSSIFFDVSGSCFPELKCGMFNSTDLAHFKGSLFFIEQNLIRKITNCINKIDIFLGYGFGQRDVLNILFLLNQKAKVSIIARTKGDEEDIYRITGVKAIGTAETPEDIIKLMKENSHED
jgi:hypothetical protein|tara:strand:+ start:676 stop:1137 length:462 start_codon:yes stop_codon:yes gene_type:complete